MSKARPSERNYSAYVVHCKKSSYDVYVGRPSPFGNPFEIGKDGSRDEVILKFKEWLKDHPDLKEKAKRELKGKILGCWCSPKYCHAEVLAEIANETDNELLNL